MIPENGVKKSRGTWDGARKEHVAPTPPYRREANREPGETEFLEAIRALGGRPSGEEMARHLNTSLAALRPVTERLLADQRIVRDGQRIMANQPSSKESIMPPIHPSCTSAALLDAIQQGIHTRARLMAHFDISAQKLGTHLGGLIRSGKIHPLGSSETIRCVFPSCKREEPLAGREPLAGCQPTAMNVSELPASEHIPVNAVPGEMGEGLIPFQGGQAAAGGPGGGGHGDGDQVAGDHATGGPGVAGGVHCLCANSCQGATPCADGVRPMETGTPAPSHEKAKPGTTDDLLIARIQEPLRNFLDEVNAERQSMLAANLELHQQLEELKGRHQGLLDRMQAILDLASGSRTGQPLPLSLSRL